MITESFVTLCGETEHSELLACEGVCGITVYMLVSEGVCCVIVCMLACEGVCGVRVCMLLCSLTTAVYWSTSEPIDDAQCLSCSHLVMDLLNFLESVVS